MPTAICSATKRAGRSTTAARSSPAAARCSSAGRGSRSPIGCSRRPSSTSTSTRRAKAESFPDVDAARRRTTTRIDVSRLRVSATSHEPAGSVAFTPRRRHVHAASRSTRRVPGHPAVGNRAASKGGGVRASGGAGAVRLLAEEPRQGLRRVAQRRRRFVGRRRARSSDGAVRRPRAWVASRFAEKAARDVPTLTCRARDVDARLRRRASKLVRRAAHVRLPGDAQQRRGDAACRAKTVAEAVGAEFIEWNIDAMVDQYVDTVSQAVGRELDLGTRRRRAAEHSGPRPRPGHLAAGESARRAAADDEQPQRSGRRLRHDGRRHVRRPRADRRHRQGVSARLAEVDGNDRAGRHRPAAGAGGRQRPAADRRAAPAGGRPDRRSRPHAVPRAGRDRAGGDPRQAAARRSVSKRCGRSFRSTTRRRLGAWVERFFRLWCRNQWKRERYAPSFHLDDENLDPKTWCRFPILNSGFERELAELREHLRRSSEAKPRAAEARRAKLLDIGTLAPHSASTTGLLETLLPALRLELSASGGRRLPCRRTGIASRACLRACSETP